MVSQLQKWRTRRVGSNGDEVELLRTLVYKAFGAGAVGSGAVHEGVIIKPSQKCH